MKKILLSTTALLAMTAMAAAADLPARTMAPAPAPIMAVPVFTWTGFYAGIHGGYIGHQSDATFLGVTGPGGFGGGGFTGGGGPGTRFNLDSDGFMFGGQVGGNVQFGAFVAGIEADISYTDVGGRRSSTPFLTGGGALRSTTYRTDMEFFGTVRGRLGFAFDRVMIYATGGLAYADLENRVNTTQTPGTTAFAGRSNDDDLQLGYTVGGGIEFAVTNNLTLKGEYLYYDFDNTNVRAVGVAGGATAADVATVRFSNDGHIGRVGLNFKF
jgi:outer membrane immunogenic protein